MSTLKKPLFVNGMYNRDGKNCRADFVREVSNGAHGVKIPLRTRGWILNSFAQCSIAIIDGAPRYSVRYYKRNSGTGSTKIYEIIEQIRAAIIAA